MGVRDDSSLGRKRGEARVRDLNRSIRRHDSQGAAGFAVREGTQRLRLPAKCTDRRK
jgi:hypothetical protein